MGCVLSNVCLFYVSHVGRAGELGCRMPKEEMLVERGFEKFFPASRGGGWHLSLYLSVGRACLEVLDEHSVLCA